MKENDLVHGEWIDWLEKIDMDRMTAHRFIKTYDTLGEDVDTWLHLPHRALYEIANEIPNSTTLSNLGVTAST